MEMHIPAALGRCTEVNPSPSPTSLLLGCVQEVSGCGVRGKRKEATGGRIGSSVVLTFPLYHSDTPFLSTSLHWGVLIVCKY